MKKKEGNRGIFIALGIIVGVLFLFFVVVPVIATIAGGSTSTKGNVALITIEGPIFATGQSGFGSSVVSSQEVVEFIQEANDNSQVKAILLEINSPGGSAVASDEIGQAVKNSQKPVVSVIREVGASGGYWIASATEHIIANRMSITGSIGVISSYLEFSGLMQEYGVRYERLVAGKYKDVGTPLQPLTPEGKQLLQQKIDRIHDYFIEEVATNRGMTTAQVEQVATGEIFLGVEALENGLIDQLGNKDTAKKYLQQTYGLKEVSFVEYKHDPSLLDLFAGVMAESFFDMGQGIATQLENTQAQPQLR